MSRLYVGESDATQVAVGGAIPKRPPPGLQLPPTTDLIPTTAMDTLWALYALFAWVGTRDAYIAILDAMQLSPELTGRVSVSTPAQGYGIGYVPRISSLGGSVGSGMDNLMYNRVIACLPAEACAAVSAPPYSIGYFPESRQYPLTITYLPGHCHRPPTTCDCHPRAGHQNIHLLYWYPLRYDKALHRPASPAHLRPYRHQKAPSLRSMATR